MKTFVTNYSYMTSNSSCFTSVTSKTRITISVMPSTTLRTENPVVFKSDSERLQRRIGVIVVALMGLLIVL